VSLGFTPTSPAEAREAPTSLDVIEGDDEVDHPSHYNKHPSGVECITVVEHMGFNVGNAIKYLWRAEEKHEDPTTDLKKALWYIQREIERRTKHGSIH
jgi:hypothetical protein